jgi:hypothetical protein
VSCTGSETFVVDPQGINARSLRGIGRSSLALFGVAATQLDLAALDKFVADDAVIGLPDGTFTSKNDPRLREFNRSFRFAPGVDVNTIVDVSSQILFLFLGRKCFGGPVHGLCDGHTLSELKGVVACLMLQTRSTFHQSQLIAACTLRGSQCSMRVREHVSEGNLTSQCFWKNALPFWLYYFWKDNLDQRCLGYMGQENVLGKLGAISSRKCGRRS